MEKELIVNSSPSEVEIALIENNKLVEIHSQKTSNVFAVGDVFLGSIRKLMPGLNAAFVDIGHRKDAFLHYTDLGPQIKTLIKYTEGVRKGKINTSSLENFEFEPDNPKNGKIQHVFNKDNQILVQILKEPISTKGPRLSCEITIPGRYMVITPYSDVIAVSKKIANQDERHRLKLLGESIKPKNFGLILRTAAEGKKVADLHEELRGLVAKWEMMYQELKSAKEPKKLLSETDKTTTLLRDLFNDSFNKIIINDKDVYSSAKDYLTSVSPDLAKIVKFYKGNVPIFDFLGITKQIKASFGKTATMSSGAYLVIEHTEAMHVIDVNSGPKRKKMDQESASLNVNLEAAEEIARQLRLRDLGGIILIDFIDMRSTENKGSLYKAMRDFMENDRAQHTILPLSKFGLMQITRQRARPEVKINTSENCPACDGTGKVNSTLLIEDEIERDLEYIMNSGPKTNLSLHTHPFVSAYLKEGFPSLRMQWLKKYMKWIKLVPEIDYAFNEYKFFNSNDDQIRLS